MAVQLCIGFDENGKRFGCPNEAGTPWTDHWCLECDEKRRARITRQLNDIVADLQERA